MQVLFKKQLLFLRLFITGVFFSSNVLFAHLPQRNFWEERQETVRKHLENFTPKSITKLDDVFTVKSNSPLTKASSFEATGGKALSSFRIGKEVGDFAIVRETYTGSTAKVQTNPILLISDVHQHTEAQKNVSNLIRQITTGSAVVGAEGTWGYFNFSTLNSFPDKQILNQAADVLLDNGKLSGVSHAGVAVSSKKEKTVAFSGVDDKALYKAHLEAYKRAVLLQTPLLERLAQELAKTQNKNPSLQAFDELVNFYEKGTINLEDFITRAKSEGWAQNLFAYSAISRFLKAKETEKKLDFAHVEHERNTCFEVLSKSLPPDKLKSLAADSVSFRMDRMSAVDYYSKLQLLVNNRNQYDPFPEFSRYLTYLKLAESIKPETLLSELENLKNDIYNRLSLNKSERHFVRRTRFVRLAMKLVRFELSPGEWEQYKKIKSQNYYTANLSVFEKFYGLAEKRDELLANNFLKIMATAAPDKSGN